MPATRVKGARLCSQANFEAVPPTVIITTEASRVGCAYRLSVQWNGAM
jgi:hypothetical protein